MQPRLFLARIQLMLIGMQLLYAVENSCTPNLPPFTYQNPHTHVLPVGVQILLPAQTFACSGSITMWGIAVNGSGSHDIHLQVWRPSSAETDNETRSFTLQGSNIFYIEPILGISLFYLMPDERRTLSVERGDVLGLYIEAAEEAENGFHVQYQKNVTNSVVYAYAVDMALDFIDPGSMPASSILLEAAPVLSVTIDPAAIVTENTTPIITTESMNTFESTTPTMEVNTPTTEGTVMENTTPTIMMEGTTPTMDVTTPAEGPINMEGTTPTVTKSTTTQRQDTISPKLSINDTMQTTPTYPVTTPTHSTATTHRLVTPTDRMAASTITESTSNTSEEEPKDTKITTQPAESDEEETVTTEERTYVSPDKTKPTLALTLVILTSVMTVGIVGACLVVTVMLMRAVRRRTPRGHGHCLPHKPIPLPPPPMSPPPPPPQYEVKAHHTKERNLQAKLTSSLSTSLTSSLIWWLHGEREQLRMLMACEYETPIVTKCHVTLLEASMHHYDTPITASAQVVNFLQSSHQYEDVS